MSKYTITLSFLIALLLLGACQSAPEPRREAITPFPTVTPGRVVSGDLLPRQDFIPEGSGLSNPATAVAIAALPTPTPDLTFCPPLSSSAQLEETPPSNPLIMVDEIVRFFNAGGSVEILADTLSNEWEVIPEGAFVRNDIDFTGEGAPEVFLTYLNPNERMSMLIVGCIDGQFSSLYEFESQTDAPIEIVSVGDTNRDSRNDLLFSAQLCAVDDDGAIDEEACEYETHLISWLANDLRFADLLTGSDVLSTNPPNISDIDGDEVSEIVVRLESSGNASTGPLRTGTNIYDWNGEEYLLSIIQLDPPRFLIQVIHEADRAFANRDLAEAISLYELALNDDNLGLWYDTEADFLRSYVYFRLLVAQTFGQSAGQVPTFQTIQTEYADADPLPIFIEAAEIFLETYQSTANPAAACEIVQTLFEQRVDNNALDLLNRYGSRSPTYDLQDICPTR